MIEFFFSHIPKCGGTHIMTLLRQGYGEDCFPVNADVARSQGRHDPDLSTGPWKGVTGHYGPAILPQMNLPETLPTFTWIRDPLMRCLSAVLHKGRHGQEGIREIGKTVWTDTAEQEYLREKILTDEGLYWKLWKGSEDLVEFVGRLEHFEEDWRKCVEHFGFPPATLEGIDVRHNRNEVIPTWQYPELFDLIGLDTAIACNESWAFAAEVGVYEKLLERVR